jgi:hypothetical protein
MKEEIDIFFVLEPMSYIALDRLCKMILVDHQTLIIIFLKKKGGSRS